MFASSHRIQLLMALVPGVVALSAPAWGQGTPAAPTAAEPQDSTKLEEVIVTARKRSESFQDVPIAVDAFTAQQIQAAGIENPRDFIAMVPNMTLVETQNVGNAFITVRGISQARTASLRWPWSWTGSLRATRTNSIRNSLIFSRSRC